MSKASDVAGAVAPWAIVGVLVYFAVKWLGQKGGDALGAVTGMFQTQPSTAHEEKLGAPDAALTPSGPTGRIINPADNGTASRTIGGVWGFGASKYPAQARVNLPTAGKHVVEYVATEYYGDGSNAKAPVASKVVDGSGVFMVDFEIGTNVGFTGADVVAELRVDGGVVSVSRYSIK